MLLKASIQNHLKCARGNHERPLIQVQGIIMSFFVCAVLVSEELFVLASAATQRRHNTNVCGFIAKSVEMTISRLITSVIQEENPGRQTLDLLIRQLCPIYFCFNLYHVRRTDPRGESALCL